MTADRHIFEWEELAIDLLDGKLTPEEASPLRAHLDSCPECRVLFEQQASVSGLLRATRPVEAPPHLRTAVLAAVTTSPRSLPTSPSVMQRVGEYLRNSLTARVWLPAAAAAHLAGVALTSYYGSGDLTDRSPSTVAAAEMQKEDGAAEPMLGADGTGLTAEDDEELSERSAAGAPEASSTTILADTGLASEDLGASLEGLLREAAALGDEGPPVAALGLGGIEIDATTLIESLTGSTELRPLPPDEWIDGRRSYVALIAIEDVAAFATDLQADLGSVEPQVVPYAARETLLPPALADMLRGGVPQLPLLSPADDANAVGLLRWRVDGQGAATDPGAGVNAILILTLSP